MTPKNKREAQEMVSEAADELRRDVGRVFESFLRDMAKVERRVAALEDARLGARLTRLARRLRLVR
jgi:hypothetical protein